MVQGLVWHTAIRLIRTRKKLAGSKQKDIPRVPLEALPWSAQFTTRHWNATNFTLLAGRWNQFWNAIQSEARKGNLRKCYHRCWKQFKFITPTWRQFIHGFLCFLFVQRIWFHKFKDSRLRELTATADDKYQITFMSLGALRKIFCLRHRRFPHGHQTLLLNYGEKQKLCRRSSGAQLLSSRRNLWKLNSIVTHFYIPKCCIIQFTETHSRSVILWKIVEAPSDYFKSTRFLCGEWGMASSTWLNIFFICCWAFWCSEKCLLHFRRGKFIKM